GSADWMDRNLTRRVEVVFPIEQPDLKDRLINEILATTLADNSKASDLLADGTYRRVEAAPGAARVRSQQRFLQLAEESAARQAAGLASPDHSGSIPAPTDRPRTARRATKEKGKR